MIRQPEFGLEGKLGGYSGVLKAISGNGAKRRATTRAGENRRSRRQTASHQRTLEKARMEEWKQMVMTEVALELGPVRIRCIIDMGTSQTKYFQLECSVSVIYRNIHVV